MKTIESEEIMLQVGSALVSLDVIERFFVCDLEKCLGACCIEGDAGAPVSEEECRKLKEILPVIWGRFVTRSEVRYRTARSCLCR